MNDYCDELGRQAKGAARLLVNASGAAKNGWLLQLAQALVARSAELIEANRRDLETAQNAGLTSASLDRLRLNDARIQAMAAGVRAVAALPDPVGRILGSSVRPNGLQVQRVGVPLGVVFFIYESRPNVTIDAAALCVKSGNAIILRGGSEALQSNTALHCIIRDELERAGLPVHA
ncbi:MAG: gamma-glutamyl-phosphate reductase, partial [Gemmataceae bacterium]